MYERWLRTKDCLHHLSGQAIRPALRDPVREARGERRHRTHQVCVRPHVAQDAWHTVRARRVQIQRAVDVHGDGLGRILEWRQLLRGVWVGVSRSAHSTLYFASEAAAGCAVRADESSTFQWIRLDIGGCSTLDSAVAESR